MLKLCGIKKTYSVAGSSLPVLGDISIDFREAEFVSVLGPSGCGKTTLLNIIGGLDKYSDGDLQINGVSTEKYRDRDWDAYRNHSIGFVFQSYNLIGHQSVLDNVAIALKLSGVGVNERRRRAMQALDSVGIADHYKKKPGQLSGGQMQRVAIARALVNNPRIILADEPTGALDTATSVQIMEILKGIAKDRLVIMVTHNPELAREYSTRVVELRDGQIISDSNPFEQIIEIEQDVVESENVEAFDASIEVEVEVDDKGKNNNKNKEVKNSKMTTSMSYLTALKLSFKNLLTKKFRTILTAIAGSIGIIGIALILSISHGMNLYITDFQRDLLGQLPIDIDRAVIRFGESSDDGNVTTGNISPRPPGMPPHFNFISREFIDFATADPILSLTEGGDGVELHYGVHTHILFSPTNTDGSSTGVAYTLPSRRQGSGAATRGAQNIVPFRLPRQNVMDAFYSTVWVNENPSIHHNAIGLTLVLNQQWQVDDSLLQLLFGTVRDVEFEELEGLEFSLAF
ncbi:MAG: ABC transporter ATP-binding protein, partial [Firmicutes bacterium]|nr:ABC transporter ATP-binding protein [Bacillota bacterium]